MAVAADRLSRKMTEEEFMCLPNDGRRWELVNGEAKEVPTSVEHDAIIVTLVMLMGPYAKGNGFMTVGQAGFRMADANIRCPDVSYTRRERVPGDKPPREFGAAAPDICIEIISPSEERAEMMAKIGEYFDSGARLVWHVFPEAQKVVVYTSPIDAKEYTAEEYLSGGDALPGFTCRVGDLFAFG